MCYVCDWMAFSHATRVYILGQPLTQAPPALYEHQSQGLLQVEVSKAAPGEKSMPSSVLLPRVDACMGEEGSTGLD